MLSLEKLKYLCNKYNLYKVAFHDSFREELAEQGVFDLDLSNKLILKGTNTEIYHYGKFYPKTYIQIFSAEGTALKNLILHCHQDKVEQYLKLKAFW